LTKPLVALVIVGAIAAGGCGGRPDGASESLQTGVYEWELSDEYLIDHGIPSERAVKESGHQEITLWEDGTFLAAWRTADDSTGSCRGTYDEGDDRLVTFTWTRGCFGDWKMTYAVDGDTVTWSDQKALPPYDSDDDQNTTKAYNDVPWTRVGDAPSEGQEQEER
jgi:hypothetical protein